MLSVLLDTEACYTIKENNKKNYFAEASYHFVGANYHFAYANWEKSISCRYFLVEAKKIWIARFFIFHHLIYILGKNIEQSDASENDSK